MIMMKKKNYTKGDAHKYAFEQINSSLGNHYPLEAICLIESIISDRLLSHYI